MYMGIVEVCFFGSSYQNGGAYGAIGNRYST